MVQIARRIAAGLITASLAYGWAIAQDTPPPPPQLQPQTPTAPPPPPQLQPPAQPPSPPAELQARTKPIAEVDPVRLAAARELLAATNTDAQFATVIPMMFAQLKQSIPPSGPKMQEELDKVFDEIQKQFIDRRSDVLDQIAALYARKFTADEMKGLAELYRSPLAQKFITAMPELTAEAMMIGNVWGRQIAMDAERKVRDEMRRRGFDL
jgi:hypothetical protein